jgi:hypothetical protein
MIVGHGIEFFIIWVIMNLIKIQSFLKIKKKNNNLFFLVFFKGREKNRNFVGRWKIE